MLMSDNETLMLIPNNKTFTINYHIVDPNDIGTTSEQYIAPNCNSWIDAINQMNYDILKEGKYYMIDYAYETED